MPNGKILCAGDFTNYNGTGVNRICRLNADGTIDGTFSASAAINNEIYCMVVLSNGQILISGSFTTPKAGIARLNADGSVDATFNMTGTGINAGRIQAFAVQADGKIVVGGGVLFTQYNSTPVNGFARLNADGSLDAAFNSGATSGINGGTDDIKIQADGKILLSGQFSMYKNASVPVGLIRINTDGSRDMTFNNGGSGAGVGVRTMALQADGKIVCGLTGGSYNGFPRNTIARINADGSLDNAFYPLGPNGVSCNVTLQSDGKILVTGSFTTYDGISRNNIARANSDGTIDISFNPGTGTNQASTIGFLLADGTFIIGGYGVGFVTYNGVSAINIARIWLDAPASVSSTSPPRNTHNSALSTPLNLNFTQAMSAGTASQSALRVWGGMSGLRSGTYSGGGTNSIGFTPTRIYLPNEVVSATLMCGAQTSMGAPASPQVMQFRARATGGSGSFPGQALFSPFYLGATTTPIGIAAADFDNDGDVDMVTADDFGAAQRVSVLTNNGQANFTVTPYSCTSYNPRAVTTGDVNNDGRQDIIAVHQGGTALIWLNNGTGGFMPVTTRTTLSDIVSVAMADIDADGDLDMIVSGNSNGVQVLRNDGTGTFGTATSIGGGHTTTAGDVDNDGDIDLISATAAGSVNVYRNNGSGTFTSNSYGTGGVNNNNIAVGDLNGDGFLDIATAHDAGISTVAVLLNNGAGSSFNAVIGSPFPLTLGATPRAIAIGDVDGDGDLDIATGNSTSNDVAVLINNGAASFTPATGSPFPVSGNTPWGITMADFDNDGDIDIATPNNVTNNVSVLLNSPATLLVSTNPARNSNTQTPTSLTLSWSQPMTTATASLPSPASIAHNLYVWGGMSGYRSLPLSGNIGGTATQSGNTTTFTPNAARPFRPGEEVSVTVVNAQATSGVRAKRAVYGFRAKAGVGPGQFQQIGTSATGLSPASIAIGDVDNDGDIDIVVSDASALTVLLNNGLGIYAAHPMSPFADGGGGAVTLGDMDNDGDIDAVVANSMGGQLRVFLNNGSGDFSSQSFGSPFTLCLLYSIPRLADVDGDGDLDAVMANNQCAGISILLNSGAGTLGAPANYGTSGAIPNGIVLGDVDNDGDVDVVVTNNGSDNVTVMINNGLGIYTVHPMSPFGSVGTTPTSLDLGDIDGDGDLDLAIINNTPGDVHIRFNDGSGGFAAGTSYTMLSANNSSDMVHFADVDGDGDLDIISAGYFVNQVAVRLNNGFGNFMTIATGSPYATGASPYSIQTGDVDGDGDMDIITANLGGANISVLLNGIPPVLTTTTPARNAPSATASSPVTLTYTQPMTTATASLPALNIWGGFSGYKTGGTRSVAGSTVTANVGGFRAGEQVWVTHTMAKSTANIAAKPYVYGFTAKAGVGPGTFYHQGLYSVNGNGYEVRTADVDGDGRLDVITSNNASGNSSVLYGAGGGSLAVETGPSPYITTGAAGIAVADFNNDGRPDYVVGDNVGNNISVMLNNAGTSFTLSSINVGALSNVITTADYNGDGAMDIAVSRNDGAVVILFGDGNGSFQPFVNAGTPTAAAFQNIASGDFDGDGDIDIVSTNSGGDMLRVMINDGAGNFSLPIPAFPSGGITPLSPAIADFNGDGILDIAIGHFGDNVAIHLGIGNGTFQAPDAYSTGIGTSPRGIVAADFDGDGFLDIAIACNGTNELAILRRVPSAYTAGSAFSPVVRYPGFGMGMHWLAAGDVDNDGDMDIIARYFGSPNVSVYLNATQPLLTTFSPPRNTQTLAPNAAINLTYNQTMTTATASVGPFRVWGGMRGFRSGTYSQPSGAASAQIALSPPLLPNEEVFVSVTNAQNANRIAARPFTLAYRARSAAAPATFFALPSLSMGSTPAPMRNIVTADFNGDGRLDAALSNTGANGVQLMYGNGAGGFTQGPLLGVGGTAPEELVTGDFNSDGRPDIAVSVSGSSLMTVLMNTGGAFVPSSYSVASRGLTVTDFNGDGALDIAAAVPGLPNINIYLGANNGSFAPGASIATIVPGYRGITTADVDNDGDMDIIAVSSNSDAKVFINTGLGTFDPIILTGTASLQAEYPFAGDFNNDGRMDFVAFSNIFGGAFLALFTGNGAGSFTTTTFGTGISTGFGNVGDFNGDGFLDVAAGDALGNAQIWLNTGGAFAQSGVGQGALGAYPIPADVDGDGDLDLLMTDWANGLLKVLLNQPAPILTATPLLLDFGTVAVGQSASQSASISGANLVSGITTGITGATVSAFSYSVNMGTSLTQGTVTVSGGATLNTNIRAVFAPITTGTFSTTLTVTTASARALTLALTGVAILPRIPTPPIITALSTTAALIGTPVTVTGLNFANVSQASIGGIATTVNILSATQANVILPTGLSIGQVVLTNVDGTAVSRDVVRALVPFLPPPIISAAAPLVGVPGDLVSVTGANFSTGATTLLIGGSQFAVTFNSSTRLTFSLQPSMQGTIGVRTPNGSTTSSFIVRVIPPPTILGINPTQASNGEAITLLGTNFINVISVTGANMRLDSTSWQIDTLAQRITVRVLENFAVMNTIGTLTLRTRSGTARFTQAYTPAGEPVGVPVPALTGIGQASPLQEGDEITLSAINIPTGATLTLTVNGITTTISSVTTSSSGTILRLLLPTGIVPLTLQSTPTLTFRLGYGGQSTTATFTTTVRAANLPQITGFSPNIGGTCSTISIVGRNLGVEPRGRLLSVMVGGAPVQGFRVMSPSVIEATLGTVRTGIISLVTSGGQVSTTGIFTFDPAFQCFPPMRREDSLALDAFYVATVGLNWTTSTNWTNPNVPAALRFGVKVLGDRVVEIRMPRNNVTGSVPDFVMANLSSLRVLDLDSNHIAGALPRTLGQATNLEILRLAANRFSGTLPPNLAALKRLRELNLSDNVLADTLEQVWDLTGLETLNLRGNRLRGRVSARAARLTLLTSLNLSRNQLSDTLPAELSLLTALQTLNLRDNRFTGALPDLGKDDSGKDNSGKKAVTNAVRALTRLDVGQNALSGAIPASIGTLRELNELRLDGNALQGVIPSTLAELVKLKTLDVSRNQFTDAPSLLPIPRLDTLRLADNRLDFATLESQVNMRPTAGAPQSLPSTPKFGYAPQSVTLRLSERTDTTVTLDAPLQLRINARGANNRYAWWRDGVLIQATSGTASLLIPSVTASDSGSYFCVVSNTLLPDVVFTSAALRVTTAFPAFPPQDSIRLIAPALAADNVSRVPTFVWTSVSGSRQYRLEVSGTADFRTILASAIVSQSASILTSGRVEFSSQGRLGFPLAASARIFWRVRAENARGLGAAASSEFTTASGDALIAADRLDFGRVPRADTAFRRLTLRNLSTTALRVESITPENGVFAIPLQGALTLAVGRDTTLMVRFIPLALPPVQSGITVRFRAVDTSGQQGALQTQSLQDRLSGSGGALKIVAPRFDTIAVRATRIASALLINVSGTALEITNIGLLRRMAGFELRFSGTQRSSMDIGDTLVIPIGCRSEVANVRLRDTLRVQTNLERIDAPLEAFSRNRTPNDVAVKLAIRPQQNNLPPGSAVTLELFVVPTGSITLDSVFRAALPFIQATVSVDKNVLALSPNERFARVRRLDTSRIARFVVPSTTWSGRNSVVAQLQCVVVAGNTDSTSLSIEDVQWGAGSVILDEVQDGTFKANVSRAGGKRLISPTATPTQLTAIAPNPAKEEIEIAYTMGEAGLVTLTLMDARGNVVLPIVNAVESAGKHTVRAKIGWLASGSYHIRLTTTLESDTRQVQIVR